MDSFKPSGDFVARTMERVRSFEIAVIEERVQANNVLLPRALFFALSAGGILLAMLNLARAAWNLIAPAACF
jgi:hypothetical protein